jgi:hypothetical protein
LMFKTYFFNHGITKILLDAVRMWKMHILMCVIILSSLPKTNVLVFIYIYSKLTF